MVSSFVNPRLLLLGALFAGSSVIVGAFGAHALKDSLDAKALAWIDTGVFYQMTHALALIACGMLPKNKSTTSAGLLFVFGILLFSGSLYFMAITGVTELAALTPLGGLCFVGGWGIFCYSVYSLDKAHQAERH